ncbi:Shikimate dehydrogenase [Planctomycetes bacterium Poly30]|uniref:shikimate dehydrogenase (NADP(+)) n=1 Tax=Saltatorellus ferox TaxID=2528018 RepID=A0A518EWV6_9BACT|nr:Shikimate dehydrogenase [Planctomycetes bacterium Poly30]
MTSSAFPSPAPAPGPIPGPIVVSLLCRTLAAFREALDLGAAADADVVEFRLDHVARELLGPGALAFGALVDLAGRPTIAAIHGSEGFGTYGGSSADRGRVLAAAAGAGVTYLDIDAALLGEARLDGLATPRILSTHRELPAIDDASLDAVADELDALVRPGAGDLVKIVPATERAEDVIVLLDWLERRPAGSTIAFASGHASAFSRMAAPAFGSVLVYAAPARIEEPRPSSPLLASAAPGQLRVSHLRAVWGGRDGSQARVPGRATRLAAVCGRPIGHSASPVTHAAALRALGADALFLPVAPTSFTTFANAVRQHPRWVGLSVTAPFKLKAIELATGEHGAGADAASSVIGAANTLYFDAEPERRFTASNTDAPAIGIVIAEAVVAEDFAGLSAVVIGAGGAARAAVHALAKRGAAVTVAARRIEAARALATEMAASMDVGVGAADLRSDAYRDLRPDIIVHTTPLGTDGIGEPEVPAEHLRPGVAVLDAVYRPRETALLRRAAAAGAIPISGERWFLLQAWLQHGTLFQDLYAGRTLTPELEEAAQRAMGDALGRWLSGETSSQNP